MKIKNLTVLKTILLGEEHKRSSEDRIEQGTTANIKYLSI
jgi:hypothetical protein